MPKVLLVKRIVSYICLFFNHSAASCTLCTVMWCSDLVLNVTVTTLDHLWFLSHKRGPQHLKSTVTSWHRQLFKPASSPPLFLLLFSFSIILAFSPSTSFLPSIRIPTLLFMLYIFISCILGIYMLVGHRLPDHGHHCEKGSWDNRLM